MINNYGGTPDFAGVNKSIIYHLPSFPTSEYSDITQSKITADTDNCHGTAFMDPALITGIHFFGYWIATAYSQQGANSADSENFSVTQMIRPGNFFPSLSKRLSR